mgnify:CR=1 FL=1
MSQFSFASGGFHGLLFAPETRFGVLPDDPQVYRFRHTSCGLVAGKGTLQSAELRDDSQISDFRLGNRQAGGDVGFEFSYGAFDMFLASAVRGAWAGNVLKAGLTRPTFTIQRLFRDIGQYETFTGCEVNSLSLKVATNAMVTGTLNFVGKDAGFSDAPLSLSPLDAGTDAPFDGFSGQLFEGGEVCATVTSVELTINNALEPIYVIGDRATAGITAGRINVTGTVSAYFADLRLLRKFLDEEESHLRFVVGDGVSHSYEVTIPRLKYSGGDNPVNDESAIQISLPFQALLDNATGSNIMIARIPGIAVDGDAPLLTVTQPSNGATDVALDADIVLNFSEPVAKGTGLITITDGGANAVAVPVEDGRVAVYGARVTVSLGAPLQAGTTYYVTVSDGALLDAAGNAFAGIADPAVLSFTTVAS